MTITRPLTLAIALTALACTAANASMLADSEGPGISKCEAFNAVLLRSDNPATVNMVFYSWAQGFMSAINLEKEYAGAQRKNLGAASYEEKVQAMVSFCAGNPNSSYMDGVVVLLNRLPDMGVGQ